MNPRYIGDRRLRRWRSGQIVAGGAPWGLIRVHPRASVIIDAACRGDGVRPESGADAAIVAALVDRGLLHPRPDPRAGPHDVTVVVPAYKRPAMLAACLHSLSGLDVIVVDDATPDPEELRSVAAAAGVRYLRLAENHGPAAARNAGLAVSTTRLVAFVDADVRAQPGWLDVIVPLFDDERVAAVAPRVLPAGRDRSVLARYESASSALDMGRSPALVRPGASLGFVPSATLVVRRGALRRNPFDERLRLGEDVDLVWRLADADLHVRYEPRAAVVHDPGRSMPQWLKRRFEYGTSAADLHSRHPGRLAPARVSPWNLAALALLGLKRPWSALTVSAVAAGLLARRLSQQSIGASVATSVVASGVAADAVAIGQTLRREYWPAAALALAVSPWSRAARLATALVLAPVLADWMRERPRLDPVRYTALRLTAEAAYGLGVLCSGLRQRKLAVMLPQLRRSRPNALSTAERHEPT
jgi:mycofactocin glycosyltransferase